MKKILLCVLMFCLLISGGLILPACSSSDNSDLVGRLLTTRAEGKGGDVYVYFVDDEIAHFSSDVGEDIKYSRSGKKIVFKDVEYMDALYQKLYAVIYESSQYKDNETYQYFFMNFYADSKCTKQVAYTYPDDTIVSKVDILRTFTAQEFEQVSHEAPSLMPDAHKSPATLSDIDEKTLNFFAETKSLTFNNDGSCVAVLSDLSVLNGKYEQFRPGEIFLNFGAAFVSGQTFIKMRVYNDAIPSPMPGNYFGGEQAGAYDPAYSNLTPPPYFVSDNICIYWLSQDSNFIIR